MEEKKQVKIRMSTFISIFELILILAMVIVFGYFCATGKIVIGKEIKEEKQEVVSEKEKEVSVKKEEIEASVEEKKEETKNTKEETIPDEDLYVKGNQYIVFVENGTAYCYTEPQRREIQGLDGILSGKIEKLSENVKRVKIYNLGTDITDTIFLIKEDGTVMECLYTNKIIVRDYTPAKEYKVEKILSATEEGRGMENCKIEVLLKDGTTKTITETKENYTPIPR